MAAEMQEEVIGGGRAVEIFREILDDPSMKDSTFQNLVTKGEIVPLPGGKRGHQRYLRSDVERVARQRLHDKQELSLLLGRSQVIERIRNRVPLKSREFDRLVETGQLPVARCFGQYRYFRPEDVDRVLMQLINFNTLRESVEGLMETSEAVAWINAQMAAQGRTERVGLGTFYKQIEREIIVPDRTIPYSKQHSGIRYFFSEETLRRSPLFKVPPAMPVEGVEPVRVTGSKSLRGLEAQWGDLVTRHGIKEEGLSLYAVKGRQERRVQPVGFDGVVQWFPARYIPQKRKRETKPAKKARAILESQEGS